MTTDFPIENLPFGVARVNGEAHICTRLHDEVLDLHAAAELLGEPALREATLNAFAAKNVTVATKQ
ncbi:MAG TPA: fumarylacetoacetase, partial [Thermoanaerobaculia bacterium]